MNVPKLRFKEFNDEWKEQKFKEFTYYSGKRNKENLNLVSYAITNNFGFIPQSLAHNEFGYMKNTDKRAYNIVTPFSFAYNPARINVGSIGYYNGKKNIIVSSLYEVFKTKEYIDDKFLWYWLKSDIFPIWINRLQEGSVRQYFYYDKLCEVSLYYPTFIEQTKIAQFLLLLDKKIELQVKKIEALKLFKKGLIVQTKSDSTQWSTIKIGNIFHSTRGVIISKSNISSKKENNFLYPVYSSQTSNNGILGYDTTYDFNGKYLTWTTDGANAGKVFYRKGKFRCTNVCGILFNDNDMYINKLMAELLNLETPKYVSYVGNPKLMNNIMENITMKIPPLKKQIFISNFLEIIDNKIELEISILSNLKHLKKGLLQNMFV